MKDSSSSLRLTRRHLLCCLGIMLLATLILAAMGRDWWCQARDFSPWSGDINSRHNSQHLTDPYTFTHVLHGLGFYGLFWLLLRKRGFGDRLVATVALESGWEILENTSFIIDKYREDTVSHGYYGDSILNSMSDVVACIIGYLAAGLLPVIGSLLVFAAIELFLLLWIRDSLLLNILMLIWPLESVRQWQIGALLWLPVGDRRFGGEVIRGFFERVDRMMRAKEVPALIRNAGSGRDRSG